MPPARPQTEPRGWRGRLDWRSWSDGRYALALTLLAWLHRLAFLCSNRDRTWGFSIFYEGDAERFYQFARAILAGKPYDGGVPFHPPGFPYVLAGVHALLGAGRPDAAVPHMGVKVIMTLLGSVPIGLIYLLVRPYLGREAALLTALLSLYSFGLYVVSVSPVSEGLYLTLLLAAMLVWTRATVHPLAAPCASGTPGGPGAPGPRRTLRTDGTSGVCALRPLRWHAVLGLVLGALTLVRAEGLLVTAAMVGIGCVGAWPAGAAPAGAPPAGAPLARTPRDASRVRRLAPWILVAAGWTVAVTPWALRNGIRLGEINRTLGPELAEPLPEFVPITLYGPLNLALANHAGADGGFTPTWMDPAGGRIDLGGGSLVLRDPAHLRLVLHGDQIAWEWIRTHPAGFGRLVLRKWGLLFESLKLGWTQWNMPGGLRGLRRPVDLFVPHTRLTLWLLAPLLLLGWGLLFVRGGASRRWALLVALLTGTTLLTTSLFYGYARAGVVMLPLWFSLLPPRIGSRPDRGLPSARIRSTPGRVLLFLPAMLLVLEIWGATAGRDYRATGTPLPGQAHLNPDALMLLEPDPATLWGWLPGK